MPPGRKPTFSAEEYVATAIAYADQHGIDALRLRQLGESMGASATTIYRYFPTKENLLSAMREELLQPVIAGAQDERDARSRIRSVAMAYRRQALLHPCLSQLLVLGDLKGNVSNAVPDFLSSALAELGLSGMTLVRAYRQLESFVVGSTSFDFAGAPEHLRTRLTRLHLATRPEFHEFLPDVQAVESVNETAFEWTLDALLDALAAEGSAQR